MSVSDTKTGNGTITNEEGQFHIFLDNMPGKLMISHVAYKKRFLEVRNTDFLKVNLPISAIQLPEFQTGNPAIAILNAVIRKAVSDTANKHYYKAFYQKVSYFNGKYTKFQQMFMNVSWSQLGVERWQPTNVRFAQFSRQKHVSANMTYVSFLHSAVIHKYPNFPINILTLTDRYSFKVKHYLFLGTQNEIAVIECKPLKDLNKGTKFEGEIYVHTLKDNLVKIKGTYNEKLLNRAHIEKKVEIVFKEDGRGFSTCHFVHLDDRYTKTFHNHRNKDEVWLYFLEEAEELNIKNSLPAFSKDDFSLLKESQYNKVFWEKRSPIKQTKIEEEIIKYFEKKGEFKSNF